MVKDKTYMLVSRGYRLSADYISFQSFEIREYILNNQKFLIGLDSCFRPSFFNSLGYF